MKHSNQHLNQHSFTVEKLFKEFIDGKKDKKQLIAELQTLEEHHKELTQDSSNKSLWFKFGKNDNLATTVRDLDIDLDSFINKEFTLGRIKACLELNCLEKGTDLQIYYS